MKTFRILISVENQIESLRNKTKLNMHDAFCFLDFSQNAFITQNELRTFLS